MSRGGEGLTVATSKATLPGVVCPNATPAARRRPTAKMGPKSSRVIIGISGKAFLE
jgi:hypothetical protein